METEELPSLNLDIGDKELAQKVNKVLKKEEKD